MWIETDSTESCQILIKMSSHVMRYNYTCEFIIKFTNIGYYTGCPQKIGTLDFHYFDIRKYSIVWFLQKKHCLLKRMIPRSLDLVR